LGVRSCFADAGLGDQASWASAGDPHDGELIAASDAEVAEEPGQVLLHRSGLDVEELSDLLVREAVGNKRAHLDGASG
jgi:hypothetical protein